MRCFVVCALAAVAASALPIHAQPVDTLWSVVVPTETISILLGATSTSDGGFAVCGNAVHSDTAEATDYFVAKVSAGGSVQWANKYGSAAAFEEASALVELPNSNLLICGWGQNGQALVLLCLSSQGDSLWSRAYMTGGLTKGYDITWLSDGNLALAGYRLQASGQRSDAWLLKCTPEGDTLWTRAFGADATDVGSRVLESSGGNLVLTGNTRSSGAGEYDIWLIRTNSLGQQIGTRTFGGSNDDICYGLAIDELNNILVVGRKVVTTGNLGYVIKTENDGDSLFTRTYGGTGGDKQLRGIAPRAGGRTLAAGWDGPLGQENGHFWILGIDENGAEEWSWTFGDPGSRLYYLIPALGGGYLAVGQTLVNDVYQGYVLRIAPPAGLAGTVTEIGTENPLEGVRIRALGTNRITATDMNGHYTLEVIPGTYDLEASSPCVEADTLFGVEVFQDSTVVADFGVGVPHYTPSQSSVNVVVRNHVMTIALLGMENTGSGVLNYHIDVHPIVPFTNWLTVVPATGTIGASQSFAPELHVLADTTDDAAFDFYANLEIHTNSCPESVHTVPVLATVLDADERPLPAARTFALHGAYPNPFNAQSTVAFELPVRSDVSLQLFDLTGRFVATLAEGNFEPGLHTALVDGTNLSSGVYLARLSAAGRSVSSKLVLLK